MPSISFVHLAFSLESYNVGKRNVLTHLDDWQPSQVQKFNLLSYLKKCGDLDASNIFLRQGARDNTVETKLKPMLHFIRRKRFSVLCFQRWEKQSVCGLKTVLSGRL